MLLATAQGQILAPVQHHGATIARRDANSELTVAEVIEQKWEQFMLV
jgi:hypothetical protein